MELLGNIPLLPCLLRGEMRYNQEKGHGTFIPAYAIGFCALPGRAPSFQVVCEDGSQWARVPIHMLVWKRCRPLGLPILCWWDCFSYVFTVTELTALKAGWVVCYGRDGVPRNGSYVFSIDWMDGGFSEAADQHKNHHVVKLQSGHFGAYPNNKIIWHDPSYIKPMTERPDFKVNTHTWSAETPEELDSLQLQYYQVKGSKRVRKV